MTTLADVRVPEDPRQPGDLAAWRDAMAQQQSAVMPRGQVTVSCSAPLGKGGLGRHLQEIVEALERSGQPVAYISGSGSAPAVTPARHPRPGAAEGIAGLVASSRVPLSPGVRALAHATDFDRSAARRLAPGEHLIAFNGQALAQLQAARRMGYASLALVSANSHIRRVRRQHEAARRRYPLEGSWARWLAPRNEKEYQQAGQIYVASRYIRESFLEEGFSEEQMADFPLTPHPRFGGELERERSERFEIVYSGSLAVHKGVPLLIDAFRRLPYTDMRLRLVGGWGSRGMRRFVQEACAADDRITAGAGDPLVHLRTAALCVHPAYEDGFGYAPAEALACGVPVLVSEDTGMKDMIGSSRSGLILATGDLDALTQAIEAAYRAEIFGG
jgi:glycosyltransferase involved in cell wall biosynthesis